MPHKPVKIVYVLAGILSLTLGFIGIFLPILPTTPFILLAAFCFSRGSRQLHHWLVSQPHLGKMIRDWEHNGVIRLRVKLMAAAILVALFSYTVVYVNVPMLIKVLVTLIGVSVLLFIWTRPSTPGCSQPVEGESYHRKSWRQLHAPFFNES